MQDVAAAPVVGPQPPDDDDVDLIEYVLLLWRRRWIILAFAAVCGLAAFLIGLRTPPIYEASVTLLVSPPKTARPGEVMPTVSVATFRSLVDNQTLAQRLIKEYKLDAPPFSLDPNSFLRKSLSVDTVRDTNLVVLRVKLSSNELAAKVANRLADLSIDLSQRLSQDETVRTRDSIRAQVQQSRERLEAAERKLTEFKKLAQIEALRKDVDAQLGQREELLELLVSIQTERAKLTQAEAQLASRKPILTLRRTIDSDRAMVEAARDGSRNGASLLGLELKDEQPDKVYEQIDKDVAEIRTKLSGLEKQKTELIDVRGLNSTQLKALNQLYVHEAELAHLQTEYELAKTVYLEVATRYEQVRLQVAGRTAQLQVTDQALAPERPVGPKVLRNTVLAVIVGSILSAIAVLFISALAAASTRDRRRLA